MNRNACSIISALVSASAWTTTPADGLAEPPPADVRTFTDAVFIAEELDPTQAGRSLYREVRSMVEQAFRREPTKALLGNVLTLLQLAAAPLST